MALIRSRDLLVAAVAAVVTAGVYAAADNLPRLHSMVVNWDGVKAEKTDAGSVRNFFRGSTPTLDQLEVHVTTLEPNHAPHAPHKHPNEELLIVKQGTIEVLVGGQWRRATAGDVVLLASNELHGVRNVGQDEAVYHVVGWRTPATPAE